MVQAPQKRARRFSATRRHHDNEAAEDYTELILDLIESHGEARTGVIAQCLGISHVTASRTLQRLCREGYVETQTQMPVQLTKQGMQLARVARARHKLLMEFLCALGVPEKIAEIDVEGIEHHISQTTLEVMKKFLKNRKAEE